MLLIKENMHNENKEQNNKLKFAVKTEKKCGWGSLIFQCSYYSEKGSERKRNNDSVIETRNGKRAQ